MTTRSETARSTIANATTKGDRHIGDIVYWNLLDAEVDRATLESRWAAAQLDPALLPEVPGPEKTLRIATKEAAVGDTTLLVRRSLETDDRICVAIVRETRNDDAKPTYATEAVVTLDRNTTTVSADQPDHPTAKTLIAAYNRMRGSHTAEDVRNTIISSLTSFASVPLRETGGVYWTPSTSADKLRRLQTCIDQFGGSSFYLIPIHDGQEQARSLGAAATKSLETELTSLKEEMQVFSAETPRPSTLVRRMKAYEELRQRAELYRTILSVKVDDMADALSTLETQARKMLTEGTSEE